MRCRAHHLSAVALVAGFVAAAPASAGKVTIFTRSQTVTETGTGQVSASLFLPDEQGTGSAYEFIGGDGVSSPAAFPNRPAGRC